MSSAGVIDGAPESPSAKMLYARLDANRLIWELWVATGNPPELDGNGKLKSLSRRHVENYRQFISECADFSEEDVHRRGLLSARRSFRSSLCFATLQYLNKRTGTSSGPIIWATPPYKILQFSPSEIECQNLSVTYDRWLVENLPFMKWDPKKRPFHTGDGRAIDTSKLGMAVSDVRVHRFSPQ